MEKTQPQSVKTPNVISKNKNIVIYILSSVLILISALVIWTFYKQLQQITQLQANLKTKEAEIEDLKDVPLTEEERQERESKRETMFFTDKILPTATESAIQIDPSTIVSAIPVDTKYIVITDPQGGYYFNKGQIVDLHLSYQDLGCELEKLDVIRIVPGKSIGFSNDGRRLVLSAPCQGYGTDNFTGVYDFNTGEQVKLANLNESNLSSHTDQETATSGFSGGKYIEDTRDYVNVIPVHFPGERIILYDAVTGRVLDSLNYQ